MLQHHEHADGRSCDCTRWVFLRESCDRAMVQNEHQEPNDERFASQSRVDTEPHIEVVHTRLEGAESRQGTHQETRTGSRSQAPQLRLRRGGNRDT